MNDIDDNNEEYFIYTLSDGQEILFKIDDVLCVEDQYHLWHWTVPFADTYEYEN